MKERLVFLALLSWIMGILVTLMLSYAGVSIWITLVILAALGLCLGKAMS